MKNSQSVAPRHVGGTTDKELDSREKRSRKSRLRELIDSDRFHAAVTNATLTRGSPLLFPKEKKNDLLLKICDLGAGGSDRRG